METEQNVTQMIVQLRSDDPSVRNIAASMIWNRYARNLLNVARRGLKGRILQRMDEEDLLQSMYMSFCLRCQRGQYDLAGRDQLWGLLVKITMNKLVNVRNHHRREKRDISCERSSTNDVLDSSEWALEQLQAGGPSPAVAAELNESLELRLQSLEDTGLREIALATLAGWTTKEIADQRGCSIRSVQRKIEMIRNRWAKIK